jgi:hypothetical protein
MSSSLKELQLLHYLTLLLKVKLSLWTYLYEAGADLRY